MDHPHGLEREPRHHSAVLQALEGHGEELLRLVHQKVGRHSPEGRPSTGAEFEAPVLLEEIEEPPDAQARGRLRPRRAGGPQQ